MSTDPLARLPVYLARLCLAVAAGLSIYLGIASLTNAEVAGCGEGGSCGSVLGSRWSHVFGVPVALAGAGVYLTLLGLEWVDRLPGVRLFLALLAAGAACWFVLVQAVLLRAFCPWCCTIHALALLGCVLLLACGRLKGAGATAYRGPLQWALPVAILALAALAGVQYRADDRTSVTVRKSIGAGAVTVEGRDSESRGPKTVSLYGGAIAVETENAPAIGDPARAANIAVGLFDYTCHHCRHLHGILEKIIADFDDQVAVVRLPAAYSDNARQIHRTMLVLWHGDREVHDALASSLHDESLQATAERVRAAAAGRLGEGRLGELISEHGARADSLIAIASRVMAKNKETTKITKLPQLMFGDEIEVGQDPNPGHYYSLFAEKYGLKRTKLGRLTVEPVEFDLGTILAGSAHSVEFTIRNRGNAPANIGAIEVPQGLQWEVERPQVIAPGGSAVIRLGAPTPFQNGPARAPLSLHSDAEPSRLDFFMKADIRNPFRFEPERLDFGRRKLGATVTASRVRVTVQGGAQLGEPVCTSTDFEVGKDGESTEGTREFSVTPIVTGRPGYRRAEIRIPVLPPPDAKEVWPAEIRYPVRVLLTGATGSQSSR